MTGPQTHIVDSQDQGDYTTIGEAIRNASAGDRILIRPGLYREGLIIDKPLEIIGDGSSGTVVLEAADQNVILFRTTVGRLANLTLRQIGGASWFALNIAEGNLTVENCDISSDANAGIAVHSGADPVIRHNRIHSSPSGGVYIFKRAKGTIEENDIAGNGFAGIAIWSHADPMIARNRIHGGDSVGVFVHSDGKGTLIENDIVRNLFVGVEVREGGNPVLKRNRIRDSSWGGVFVHTGGFGTFEENEITGNSVVGLAIREGGNPLARRNRIQRNGVGVAIYEEGAGTLEENDLRDNEDQAWRVMPDSEQRVARTNNIE
jgi:F-box protein 11